MSSSGVNSRPARKQISKEKVLGPQRAAATRAADAGKTYNIYYDRWSGGNTPGPGSAIKDKAPYRCKPDEDAGRTRGTFNPNAYFCAFFAKGCCPHGEECAWLHRIPTRQDQIDSGRDVFGRERFDDHRQDRGGVGSMRSNTRTLFVGRIHISGHHLSTVETTIETHFRPWGEIERIKILPEKGVAFVTYENRLNAEFAKEAMANQSLDHNEVLNIRWATEDPNPKMQAMNKRKAVEMTLQAVEARLPIDTQGIQHLPGSEELELLEAQKSKRNRTSENDASGDQADESSPALYLGSDGQYYYDYGQYGYNHETQQYDPARLDNYVAPLTQQEVTQNASPSFIERIETSLKASQADSAIESKTVPAKSALGALAAYGSDSESESDS
ncbi:Pre-mRNA-splicing factor [Podila humilis]|nr:Pre-mRNA-splicing factor [Podila humilis]